MILNGCHCFARRVILSLNLIDCHFNHWVMLCFRTLNCDRSSSASLFFAPGEHEEVACQSTVFEPHWLSLFCAPSDPQLGLTIIGQHCFSRQVNLRKSPVNQLCLNLIGCHCFARRVILNWDRPSLASIVIVFVTLHFPKKNQMFCPRQCM